MDAKLNQSDLISLLAKESNISAAKAELFTKNFFDLIIEGLEQDGIVKINGFGTFKITEVARRGSVDVNTGAKIEIKGHKKLSFIPADGLKDNVNQPFAMFEPVEVDDTYQPESVADEPEGDDVVDEDIEEAAVPQHDMVAAKAETVAEEMAPAETVEEPQAIEETEQVEETVEEQAPEETAPFVEEGVGQQIETEPSAEPIKEETAPVVEQQTVETVEAQPRPAEPVMVHVPKKKAGTKDVAAIPERKKSPWRYAAIAAVLAVVVFLGITFTAKENDAVADGTKNGLAEDVEKRAETAALAMTDAEAPSQGATVAVPRSEAATPADAHDISPVTVQPVEANTDEQPAGQHVAVEPNASTADEVYNFVMVQELASTRLKDITLADTTLYVADGDLALHTVAPDETLTKIARNYFGDKKLWPYIVKYNNMAKPDALSNGMEIRIPRLVPAK